MRFVRFVLSILVAMPGGTAAISQGRSLAAPDSADQIEVIADFYQPAKLIFAVSREMCDTAFHTSLAADPELPALETKLPGLADRMVKTATSLCDAEMKKVLDARRERMRADLVAQWPAADLARTAKLLRTSVQQVREFKIDVRPGYTMQQIVAQATPTPQHDLQLREEQIAFARTPGGIAILNRIQAFQASLRPLLAQDQSALQAIANRAYAAAHREANLYAQQNGVRELYADAPVPPLPPSQTAAIVAAKMKLPGSFLYIYSFLDVRREEYTPKVLEQFDADLVARLSARRIDSKLLRFSQSPRSKDEFFANKVTEGAQSRLIPVGETVDLNSTDERATKARFRLIIFPENFTVSGAWRFYDIRFILMDTETNQRFFEYTYSGKHMVILKNSENAEARSKKILDGAFEEMQAKGVF